MPVCVRSAGHYRLPPGRREPREPGEFVQVFWSLAGAGTFRRGGKTRTVRPGEVFYYAAGEPHALVAGAEGWEYRWLTFDGAQSAELPARYGLARLVRAGACPAGLFAALDQALRNATGAGEQRAAVLGHEILLLATAGAEASGSGGEAGAAVSPVAEAAKAHLERDFAQARLNVASLAAGLGVHRATLHRAFRRAYGVSPVGYLGRLRLSLGLELLTGTVLPVAEVAVRCGVPDVAYFSKLVTRSTGLGPRRYRERHRGLGAEDAANKNDRVIF